MSRLYVYALAGSRIAPFTAAGRRVYSVDLEGVHVVADRRPTAAMPSEEALLRQHAVVEALGTRAEAVLPARFGSLVELGELRRLVAERRDTIRAALDAVQGREQMTLRIQGRGHAPAPAKLSSTRAGTAYLEARRAAAVPPDPAVLEPIRHALTGLIEAERIQPGRGVLPAAVFHLIAKGHAADYRARIEEVARRLPAPPLRVSGPWPAFAFTPELF